MVDEKNLDQEAGSAPETEQPDSPELKGESGAGGAPGGGETSSSLEALLAEKDEKIKELSDRLLRAVAESENTRKRLEKERREAVCFANESIIREILNVLDNLERAVQHGEENAGEESLLEGVKMTVKSFHDTLEKFGCKAVDAIGAPFDPNYHEAISQIESTEYPSGSVVSEFRKGYTLNDRLLRAALVVVGKSPATESNIGESGEEATGDGMESADAGSGSAGG